MKQTINKLLANILGYNPQVNTGDDIEKVYRDNWQQWKLGENYEVYEAIYVIINRNYAKQLEDKFSYTRCILENGRNAKNIHDALKTNDAQIMIEIIDFQNDKEIDNTLKLITYLKKLSKEINEEIILCVQINENYYDTFINNGIASMEYPFEIEANNRERVLNDIYDLRYLYAGIDLDSIKEFKIKIIQ